MNKVTSSYLALVAALLLIEPVSSAASDEQCFGIDPQPQLVNFLGATLDYSTADHICCNNHRFAEYKGYLAAPEVDLFGRLDPDVETVYYDSVCGIPLFIAPRGRSFDEFKEESLHHGWPSFRPEEIVSENVIIHGDGRMESRCNTHLGHNLPLGGVDRYCIDLVCIAGAPLPSDDEKVQVVISDNLITADKLDTTTIITADKLNTTTYESSAEQFSGNYNNWQRKGVIAAVVIVSVAIVGVAIYIAKGKGARKKMAAQQNSVKAPEQDDENSSGTHSITEAERELSPSV